MNISDLKDKAPVDELTVEIANLDGTQEFENQRGTGRMQGGLCKDSSGEVRIVFWDDDCDRFKVGDTLQLSKGWSKNYNGEMQIGTGKYGELRKC